MTPLGIGIGMGIDQRGSGPIPTVFSYAPGDTLAGETFTRTTTATYYDVNGVVQTAAINTKRDGHYIGGVRSLLLEPERTNLATYPLSFDNAAWAKTNVTVTTGQADPAGGTAARLLSATVAAADMYIIPSFTGNASKVVSVRFKKGTAGVTTFGIFDSTAGVWRHRAAVTWDAGGVPTLSTAAGAGTLFTPRALSSGWYEIAIAADGILAASSNLFVINPAGRDSGLTGTVYAYGAQAENAVSPSSLILGAEGATVTRGVDNYYVPWVYAPQAMTVYDKRVFQVATADLSAGYHWAISSSGIVVPFLAYRDDGVVMHAQPGPSYHYSSGQGAATYGQTLETMAIIAANVVTTGSKSVDGAAEVFGTPSASGTFGAAWSAPTLLALGGLADSTGKSNGAIQSFKIALQVATMAQMRSAV